MKNNKYIKLETGQVVNYGNKPKELKETDLNFSEEKRLFSIFSDGDGKFDKKDYDTLWNLVVKYANKNGNADVLDDDERQAMLDELINTDTTQDKVYNNTFRDFLLKVFQKQDKIVLKDTADLNIDFHEMKEKDVLISISHEKLKEKENLSNIAIAENFFNPDNLECKTEYYDGSSVIKAKTILGKDGKPERMMFFDEDGTINRVEIKTETGYKIMDFENNQNGAYGIIITSADKTVKSETDYILGQKCNEYIYESGEGLKYEHTYNIHTDDNETNYLREITEYKNNKKYKRTNYNSEGIITGRLEFVYDSDSEYPSELLSYDGRGNLILRMDNKTGKNYDGNGNEIKESNLNKNDLSYWEKYIRELNSNLTAESLAKILQKESAMDVIGWYVCINTHCEGNNLIEHHLIDRILDNPNTNEKKEQVSVLVEAIRRDINSVVNRNYWLKAPLLQEGINKINKLLDECLTDEADSKKIKANIETVLYILKNPYQEFSGFSYTEKPNGKYDQYAYQNRLGDCWLLSSFDALSEIEGGQDYINSHIENQPEKNEITIKLMGGKVQYTFTYEELDKAYSFSIGEPDAKAIEMAYDKYFREFKPGGDDSIDGNWMENAYWILSGNEPMNAVIQNGKAGVIIDGEFIEISTTNRNKLKHIPINIENITPEIMVQVKEIQDFTAKTTASDREHGSFSHAFYITEISDEGHITVKEPNNPTNSRTYTQDYYNKIYNNEMTIFII